MLLNSKGQERGYKEKKKIKSSKLKERNRKQYQINAYIIIYIHI